MSRPDAFDRQFRRTAQGMRRRPGPQTWERIEQRLDARRGGGARIFGIRPWLIAAVLLLFAGYAALTVLPTPPTGNALVQRAQQVEDLAPATAPTSRRIPDYAPLQDGRPDGYLISRTERSGRVVAAPKYRL